MKLVINVGIWNIVAHIAFKFYPGAFETFSTGSTPALTGASLRASGLSALLGDDLTQRQGLCIRRSEP